MVVTALAGIASTLEALAAEGVAHRDIKPDNLFRLGDRWVIGDFGLVSYPEKDPRTEHGRRLGPIDFMAPKPPQQARPRHDSPHSAQHKHAVEVPLQVRGDRAKLTG
jgi:serine/threonine protein kinase